MPTSMMIRQSYPLPPPSTVIGMVHAACAFDSYVPMKISVQGRASGSVSVPYIHYSFNQAAKFEDGRHTFRIPSGSEQHGVVRGLQHIELNCDMELVLHIIPDSQEMAERIAEGLYSPSRYPSLGRYEDSLRIDGVDMVQVEQRALDETVVLQYDAYISDDDKNPAFSNLQGTIFRFGKVFETDSSGRHWKTMVNCRYVMRGTRIAYDDDEDMMIWAEEGEGFNPLYPI